MKARRKSSKPRNSAARAKPRAAAVTLAAECTLPQANALRSQLAAVFAQPAATIDVSAVRRIDTANLQLLAAFVRDRRAAGLAVEWLGAAQAFTQSADRLGLRALLA